MNDLLLVDLQYILGRLQKLSLGGVWSLLQMTKPRLAW